MPGKIQGLHFGRACGGSPDSRVRGRRPLPGQPVGRPPLLRILDSRIRDLILRLPRLAEDEGCDADGCLSSRIITSRKGDRSDMIQRIVHAMGRSYSADVGDRASTCSRHLPAVLQPMRTVSEMSMVSYLKRYPRKIGRLLGLPAAAWRESVSDMRGLSSVDPGIDRVVEEGVVWIGLAQDHSRSHDGGVARHFSLVNGWGSSYPETTGYIVPTMLAFAEQRNDEKGEEARQRARQMIDWLVSVQFPGGGFQGGTIGASPVVPVTFNTGQILLGLAAGVEKFG